MSEHKPPTKAELEEWSRASREFRGVSVTVSPEHYRSLQVMLNDPFGVDSAVIADSGCRAIEALPRLLDEVERLNQENEQLIRNKG